MKKINFNINFNCHNYYQSVRYPKTNGRERLRRIYAN